jgi:uncharacterized protein YkwD
VLANFPVYCGAAPPARPPSTAIERLPPQDPAVAERELMALVEHDRAVARLRPLRWDRRLGDVARAHSREMAATGVIEHVSPRTGNAADRVRRAGLEPLLVTENVGRAYSAAQAERGFMTSPGHRANVIDPRVTHGGLGVAAGAREGSMLPLFFTQLFAEGL